MLFKFRRKNDLPHMSPTTLEYARCFGDFEIVDAELISNHVTAFLVGTNQRRRLVLYDDRRDQGQQWHSVELDGSARCLGRSSSEQAPILVADTWRIRTFALDGSTVEDETLTMDREDKGGCRGGLGRIKQVNGQVWACGANRTLGLRRSTGDWRWWTDAIPLAGESGSKVHFDDVDGFPGGDVYALAEGEIWRMQNQRWELVHTLRGRQEVTRVCCGADGQVYLGSPFGHMLRGRDDIWTPIKGRDPLGQFQDLVWFDGQLWATGNSGGGRLWTVDGERMRRVQLAPEIAGYSGEFGGSLSVCGERMLLANKNGVALLQNGQWRRLLDRYKMLSRCKADGTFAQAEEERKAIRMSEARPVAIPRVNMQLVDHDATGTSELDTSISQDRLLTAIEALNQTLREYKCLELHDDDLQHREEILSYDFVQLGSGASAAQVNALNDRLGHSMPPALRDFYLQYGHILHKEEFYCLLLHSPAAKLKALDAEWRSNRLYSMGLIDAVRHAWGNSREELEPGVNFSDAEIDALNQYYTVFGRYNRSEGLEASGYLFFDRAGRFDRIWFSQDGVYGSSELDFFSHCERLLTKSTAKQSLNQLLLAVIDEMVQSLRREADEGR